jgi:hypothetical protein
MEFETLKECTLLVRLCDQDGLNYYLSKEDNAELIIPRIYLMFNNSDAPTKMHFGLEDFLKDALEVGSEKVPSGQSMLGLKNLVKQSEETKT